MTGSQGAAPPEAEDEIQPADPGDAADAELAEARELDKVLCRKRGCCVTKAEDAGRDGKGHTLTVVTVDGSGGACLAPPSQQPEPFGSGLLDREPSPFKRHKVATASGGARSVLVDPDAEPDEPQESGDCRPFEFHLVVRDKGQVRARQLLSQACNDGHGTAGAGDDLIAVDARARTFTHTQSGGSAWRGDHSITVGLDPLRIARVETSSFWAGDADGSWQSTEWNWDLFSGDKTWPVVDCGRQTGAAAPAASLPRKKIRGLLIPRVTLPAAFTRDGWRTTALGACAIHVDGKQQGFVVRGAAGKATDASMRVVLSREDVLFVEVTDDRWVDKASSWTKEDHVEVWMGDAGINGSDRTCGGQGSGARQWGIRVADGTVSPGFGAPPGLSGVEAARTRRISRLKIPLGVERATSGVGRLTVVYSDNDGGPRTKRLLATSQLESGRSETLGDLWEVNPAQAVCTETGKRKKSLTVSRVALRPIPNQPVVQP